MDRQSDRERERESERAYKQTERQRDSAAHLHDEHFLLIGQANFGFGLAFALATRGLVLVFVLAGLAADNMTARQAQHTQTSQGLVL